MKRNQSPSDDSDAEIVDELAAILARGVLRLRQRRRRGGNPPSPARETRPETAAQGLEVRAKTVLSVSTRVNAPESLEP
jgi:hypothetical protein